MIADLLPDLVPRRNPLFVFYFYFDEDLFFFPVAANGCGVGYMSMPGSAKAKRVAGEKAP